MLSQQVPHKQLKLVAPPMLIQFCAFCVLRNCLSLTFDGLFLDFARAERVPPGHVYPDDCYRAVDLSLCRPQDSKRSECNVRLFTGVSETETTRGWTRVRI